MKTYTVDEGVETLLFRVIDDELKVRSFVTSGTNIFDESELIDDPIRIQNGTNVEIDDDRFALVHEFSKHGYSIFQRWKDDDDSADENRFVLAVPFKKVQVSA